MRCRFLLGLPIFIFLTISAHAELQWRKVSVIPELDRYGGPIIDDIALKPNGDIYVIQKAGILVLENGKFVTYGGDARNFGASRHSAKIDHYLIRVKIPEHANSKKKTELVSTSNRPPKQISGIANRLAFTASGEMWVGAHDGYIYRNHLGDTWSAVEGVRGDTIFVSPNGKTAIVKSGRPRFKSHLDWLERNPLPQMLMNGSWEAQKAIEHARSFAFDSKSIPMALVVDPVNGEHSLLQYQSNTWAQIEAPENIRNIQSDANGNIIALAYESARAPGEDWVHTNRFIYRWADDRWTRDPALPDLTSRFYLDKNYYGKLVEYKGLPTWVSEQSWTSVKDVAPRLPEETQDVDPVVPPTLRASGTTWYGVIETLDPNIEIDPAIVSAWEDGAYLYLREGGGLGLNWDHAGDYEYDVANGWMQDEDTLVIRFGLFMYVFALESPYTNGVANLLTAFEMNIKRVEQ